MVGDFTTSVERKVKGMGVNPHLVVESAEERKRIIDSIQHNQAHLGRETKHLKSCTSRYGLSFTMTFVHM